MLIEGEKLKALLASARGDVLVCAPFIKRDALQVLLDVVNKNISICVVTRWRPDEVARGVSDLSVLDLIQHRPRSKLKILDQLHAKLYVADKDCLVGSANVTLTGLGWSKSSNVELLTSVPISDPSVQSLLQRIALAREATYQMQKEVAELAGEYDVGNLPSGTNETLSDKEISSLAQPWLPNCSAPDKLYSVYANHKTTVVTQDTKQDALSDLRVTSPPEGLNEADFKTHIANAIRQLPSFELIIERIPGRLSDNTGVQLVQEIRPDFSAEVARKQWTIVREWIRVFLADQYEVAPDSYVVRLKS